jgi:hypothetical protein
MMKRVVDVRVKDVKFPSGDEKAVRVVEHGYAFYG